MFTRATKYVFKIPSYTTIATTINTMPCSAVSNAAIHPNEEKMIEEIVRQKVRYAERERDFMSQIPTFEKEIEKTNWLMRPLARALVNDILHEKSIQKQHLILDPTTLKEKVKSDIAKILLKQKQLSQQIKQEQNSENPVKVVEDVEQTTKNAPRRSMLIRLFGLDNEETTLAQAVVKMFTILKAHIGQFEKAGIFKDTGLSSSKESWVQSEFMVWCLHLWVVMRRLRYEGERGALMSRIMTDQFWSMIDDRIVESNISQFALSKYQRQLQEIFYGMAVQFDEAITTDTSSDGFLAESIWRHFYGGEVDNLKLEHLNYWIRYLRFNLSLFDHMDWNMIISGAFELHLPNSSLVQSF